MMFLLYCYFNQINAGLVIIKDFFQKHSQKKKNPDQSQTFFNVKKTFLLIISLCLCCIDEAH